MPPRRSGTTGTAPRNAPSVKTPKSSDLIVPVSSPYLLCATNVLMPGFGTVLAACVNPEGFNRKVFALGLLIHFIFFMGFAQWPVHLCIAAVLVFCELSLQFCCNVAHVLTACATNCCIICPPVWCGIHFMHFWFAFSTFPVRMAFCCSFAVFCLTMPGAAFWVCHLGARFLHMYWDYQMIRMSEAKLGNGQ